MLPHHCCFYHATAPGYVTVNKLTNYRVVNVLCATSNGGCCQRRDMVRVTRTGLAGISVNIRVWIGTPILQPFNGLFSRTTWVSRYQIGKTNLDAHTGGQLECPYRLITGLVRPSSNSLLTIVCDSTEQHKTIFWLPVQQLMQRTLTGCPHCIHSTCALRLLSKLTMTVKGNNYLRHVVCFWCRAVTQRFENSAQIVRN